MSPNLDLKPARLMLLEIFEYTFQTVLQVKEFICTCKQYIVNYTDIFMSLSANFSTQKYISLYWNHDTVNIRRFLFLFHRILIVLVGFSSVTLKSMFSLENKKRDIWLCPGIHKAVQAVVQFFFFFGGGSYNNLSSNKKKYIFLSLQKNLPFQKFEKSSNFIRQRSSNFFFFNTVHAFSWTYITGAFHLFLPCMQQEFITFALRLLLLMETPAEISTGSK